MNEFLEYAARGKNSWWRYILCCITAFIFVIIGLIVLLLPLTLAHALPADFAQELQHPKDAVAFFLGTGLTFGGLMLGLIASTAIFQRKRVRDIIGRWRWRYFLAGLVIWLGVQCLSVVVDFLIAPKGFSITASQQTWSLAFAALVGISVQSFAEEFIFRGYLTQGLLLAIKKPLPAAIVSGLIFGAAHISNGIPQTANAVVFGIVCALIAIRTGGIAFTYGLHLTNNLFGAIVVVSSSDVFNGSPGILSQNTPQLVWSDLVFSVLAFVALAVIMVNGRIQTFAADTRP